MTRTHPIISIAAALGATMLFTSAAQACISCEYVPEVLNASKDHDRRSYRPEASHTAKLQMREQMARAQAAKAQMAKMQALKLQAAKLQAAKARAAAAQKIETASLSRKEDEMAAKPTAQSTDNKAEAAPAEANVKREKPVSTATLLVGESVATESAPAKPLECKKFVAAVGTTVTVPCK